MIVMQVIRVKRRPLFTPPSGKSSLCGVTAWRKDLKGVVVLLDTLFRNHMFHKFDIAHYIEIKCLLITYWTSFFYKVEERLKDSLSRTESVPLA